MSSPFSIFRRNQRILMVVTTGLAMISFVLLGAISDPREIPTPLIVVFLAAIAGGIGWLLGLSRGKSSDWGVTGVILGALIAVFMIWSGRESNAVVMNGSDLTRKELIDLMRERNLANQFVQMAIVRTNPDLQEFEFQQRMMQFSFGGANTTEREVVLGEALRMEADSMHIDVTDQVVTEYINQMTDNKMTSAVFTEIRQDLGVTEQELLDVLKKEIRGRQALVLLYQQNQLTPQNFWEFYQKLNLQKSAQVASIPVSEFQKQIADPTDAEIESFFLEYRTNFPGMTPDGRLSEGRPGFYQPRRVRVAYLEAIHDQIEATVGEVTDEEIQARYEEEYMRAVPEDEVESPLGIGNEGLLRDPLLNEAPVLIPQEDADDSPAMESEEEAAQPDAPSEPEPAPEAESPAETETPKEEPAPEAESPQETETSESETPEGESSESESPESEGSEEGSSEEAEGEPEALLKTFDDLQFVAYQEEGSTEQSSDSEDAPSSDEPSAEEATETSPADESPAAESEPAPEKSEEQPVEKSEDPAPLTVPSEEPANADETASDESSADDKPEMKSEESEGASEETSTEEAPAEEDPVPPAPESDTRELTEQLKLEIRDTILRERTVAEIQKRMTAAQQFVAELGRNVAFGEVIEEGFISLEEATEQIKKYAAENDLEYIETPFMSAQELRESEDYPIGSGFVPALRFQEVPVVLFSTSSSDRLRPQQARNLFTGSEYVFWKFSEKPAYPPESLKDEPNLRAQVIDAWKKMKALPLAKERAEELAEIVRKSDKPMVEALSDERVTNDGDNLFLTVKTTGEFSWMTQGFAPSTGMQQQAQPRRSVVAAAPDAGERFFEMVFEELTPSEVGVVPNDDDSAIYIVQVEGSNESTAEKMDAMRKEFLDQGFQFSYMALGRELLSEYAEDISAMLWNKYDVQLYSSDPEVNAGE
ncbi:hypothetical protein KOR42_37100 [Thalassoglobus neptunius]|uniref:Periplasmic folding chaperone n=1 Tax=Thalassoglobus neptunius TaxID=1938619 RepID=A0A5C5WGW8_9PLAN|nr:hypothetical protein [Thalassoglobus neptunius]TWT50026.1 hypothetical protein KOR42_37100 [Thalassoglobus neptunius]